MTAIIVSASDLHSLIGEALVIESTSASNPALVGREPIPDDFGFVVKNDRCHLFSTFLLVEVAFDPLTSTLFVHHLNNTIPIVERNGSAWLVAFCAVLHLNLPVRTCRSRDQLYSADL
jgi:hypothetical protein